MSQVRGTSNVMLLKKLYKITDRKPIWQIFVEFLYLTLVYRTPAQHYFGEYLFKKGVKNIRDYLPKKILRKITAYFNDRNIKIVDINKLFYDFYYSPLGINLPKVLMYNHRKLFIIDHKPVEINTSDEFSKVLSNLMLTNSLNSIFIKATYWSWGGANTYKIFAHQLVDEPHKIDALYAEVIKTGFLFQETIKQHQVLERLNPSCINTIRMDTFIDRDGNIEILSAYLRMSIKNAHADNHALGGCAVNVDLETGKLCAEGYVGVKQDLGVPLLSHPVTHVVFENFQVPCFEQAKESIIKAASYMPGLRLIGWDIGISESGPVLIEANPDYGMDANDFAAGGFMSNPVFKKIWKEYHSRKV